MYDPNEFMTSKKSNEKDMNFHIFIIILIIIIILRTIIKIKLTGISAN